MKHIAILLLIAAALVVGVVAIISGPFGWAGLFLFLLVCKFAGKHEELQDRVDELESKTSREDDFGGYE
jgi:hypothetical protein